MSLLKSILKLFTIKRIKFIDKCQSKAAFYGTTYNILPCFLEFGFAINKVFVLGQYYANELKKWQQVT